MPYEAGVRGSGSEGRGGEPLSRSKSGGPFLVMIHVLAYPASQKEQMHHSKDKGTLSHDIRNSLVFSRQGETCTLGILCVTCVNA